MTTLIDIIILSVGLVAGWNLRKYYRKVKDTVKS